jgi:hypothetical protein
MAVAHFVALPFVLNDPGVPLRSTPGFMLSHRFAGLSELQQLVETLFFKPIGLGWFLGSEVSWGSGFQCV